MENAVDALKQAAAVLIFIIAITTAFTMFSKAKTTADSVIRGQDQIEYLESASLEDTLYTSSEAVKSGTSSTTQGRTATMTTKGDRIVDIDDVISTIYRYYLEKYGVTIIEDGIVKARFDSNTESFVQSWTEESTGIDKKGKSYTGEEFLNKYADDIKEHIKIKNYRDNIDSIELKDLYKISGTQKEIGAPWLGSPSEIIKRISADIEGTDYKYSDGTAGTQTYEGKGIKDILKGKKIIEVVNEIDNSKYLKDGENETSLLQQYELPTIEIVYVIY